MFQRYLLDDADVQALSDAVLTILEKVGALCQSQEMLRALAAWGADVDYQGETVHFPRRLVEEFAASMRREPEADSGQAMQPAPLPGLGTQVAQFFYDDATGERRPGGKADLIYLTKLGDVLHGEEGVGHSLLLRDVPPLLEPLEAGYVLAEWARKPAGPFAWDVRQVDYLIEMGEILGQPNWFTMGAICFAHPLRFDQAVAERVVRMAKLGYSIGLTGMQVAGASTPVTISGFVAVSAAEFIATWIVGRAINPKVHLGGIIWPATVDMHNGEVSYSAPDAMLRGFATAEFLRRWCGRSIAVSTGEYSSAKLPGLYAALEKAYKAMTIAAFTGRHPSLGEGMLDTGKTISAVQLLLDREYTLAQHSLAQKVDCSAESIGMESIIEIGYGLTSNHLLTEHTLRHFRDSLWIPKLISRGGWNGYEEEKAVLEKVRQHVEELVAQYRKPERDPDMLARLRAVIERARRQLL